MEQRACSCCRRLWLWYRVWKGWFGYVFILFVHDPKFSLCYWRCGQLIGQNRCDCLCWFRGANWGVFDWQNQYLGWIFSRNIPWFLRNFWGIWFEADKVFLDLSRRHYLEYKFGTIKSLNCYNNKLGRIPYYIWVGCDKSKSSSLLTRINCFAAEPPYLALSDNKTKAIDIPVSKGHEAALINFQKKLPYPSIYYRREVWRVYFDEIREQYAQFKNRYVYAFTWEYPREDHNILNFTSEDTILDITSAGDNILAYATLSNPPKRILAVDLNPCQNHLL